MLRKPKSVQELSAKAAGLEVVSSSNKRKREQENVTSSRINNKKPPVPLCSSTGSKKRLTPQELRDRLSETRSKLKDNIQEVVESKEQILSLKNALQESEDKVKQLTEKNAASAESEAFLKLTIVELEQKISNYSSDIECLNSKIVTAQKEWEELSGKVSAGLSQICTLEQDLFMRNSQLGAAKACSDAHMITIAELTAQNNMHISRIAELEASAHSDELSRRNLHNQVQELKGNIRVFCRVRPASNGSIPESISFPAFDTIEIMGRNDVSIDGSTCSRRQHAFTFDRVFNPLSTQEEIWLEISQLCTSAIDGYKVAVFAYGQTGSGKTFTMEGPPPPVDKTSIGMIPRSISQIFNCVKALSERSWVFQCSVTYVEIYNEQIFDLLGSGIVRDDDLKIKHAPDASTEVVGAIVEPVLCEADVFPLLTRASQNRATARTKQNERSSRSHSVFQMTIRGSNSCTGQNTVGVLNLIDLAGSERLKRSESTGDTLKETQNINKSLSCLGDVISSLSNKSKHVPYRNSKLTYLLQNCFGGDSKCLMFVNIAPEEDNLPESLSSLRFASKVNSCHLGTAKRSMKVQ
uniref:Kinesin-like protein n=1 Tax=Spongospora subterranea TaxID=70186 RepID=A0A0H5R871_9EUKA|eukprot:CRZ10325.1 hypothetical protein [Spongospora subterranea]